MHADRPLVVVAADWHVRWHDLGLCQILVDISEAPAQCEEGGLLAAGVGHDRGKLQAMAICDEAPRVLQTDWLFPVAHLPGFLAHLPGVLVHLPGFLWLVKRCDAHLVSLNAKEKLSVAVILHEAPLLEKRYQSVVVRDLLPRSIALPETPQAVSVSATCAAGPWDQVDYTQERPILRQQVGHVRGKYITML